MLKAILFDMDDTIIDWGTVDVDWEANFRKHIVGVYDYIHNHVMPLEDKEAFVSTGWKITLGQWMAARDTLKAPHVERILIELCECFKVPIDKIDRNAMLEAYGWGLMPGAKAFDDALEVLPDLKDHGLRLGLVTNASHPIEMRDIELEALGLIDFLDDGCRLSAADVGYLKPHPAIFELALERLGHGPEEVVFVGDSFEADIVGAQSVGMKAVLRRIRHRADQLANINGEMQPDAVIDTLRELYPLLDAWYPGWQTQNAQSDAKLRVD